MEDIVLYNQGTFDLVAELDIFAQHFTVPLRAASHHQVLITDKTAANVLALAELVLDPTDSATRSVLGSAEALCRSWMPLPLGLTAAERVQWTAQRVEEMGLIAA